tara:strand:- start:648 stop:857 length:210 start_codon:yes stop_codon:yes gene_type:complete
MEKLNLNDIFEIQEIKSILITNTRLHNMFCVLLKIVNKKVNNDDLEEIIETDTETEQSLDLSSDSSDEE